MDKLKLISLYTGAGGLDYGFEAAGFRTCVAVEFDHDCCRTIRANRDWPVIDANIHDTPSQGILDAAGLPVGEVDCLIGGPPCQPFSKSAYWVNGDTKRLDDPRANTLGAFMRVVDDTLPKTFLLENVHGISYSGKEEGFLLLARLLADINKRRGTGYEISWAVLNAAAYGVPQIRQRFFLVSHREGGAFRFPAPTHVTPSGRADAKPDLFDVCLEPTVTAWDAIGDMVPAPSERLHVNGRWADLLPSIPEGENYLWHTNRKCGLQLFGWRRRYWGFLLKLAKNRPSWTIQAQPGAAIGPFHWRSRRLSVEEMARIQTFPKNLEYAGGRTSVQKQLGNAVPSLLAEVLAREIADQFFGTTLSEVRQLAVELKRPIPPPEPVAPVPRKYLSLVGDHPDHPGEGRSAKARTLWPERAK
ncbi:DNA cytosine methyltransferase [Planctomycetota bacterium]